ncbi:unnamed protein product [Arabis nemorensis]|uniref:Uncharacterized protein n=1 Tax=Arabis nemorensis TaxID=586526 RepID=A0A565BJT3_9BRAS|nr:unnamed protein product [Arabis nemorensis]
MECRLDLKKASSDRPPFVPAEKKVLSKETQRSFPLDKFRDDKRGLSYSDFHREITKKVEDVCPKRLENRLKSRIGRTASGERDLVKYKSYVPSYIKKCEKLEGKDVKAGSIGSPDLRNNRKFSDKQMDKHTRSSLSNTSTSSSLWTDESSTDSSRGLCVSPFRKRINNPPLQYYLMSSKPGDCSQDFEPPRDNNDTSQSHSFLPGYNTDRQRDPTGRDGQFHQSPRGTAFLQNEKKDSDFKLVPKTRTFLCPSKPDSPSCTRVISRNLADDFKKKGEKLDERNRNPRVHDLFGKEKPAAVFVPGIVSQKQLIGLSKFYDSKVLLAERVAEANRKGLPEKLAYGQGAVLESDVGGPFRREADGSKPFLKRINFLSAEKNRISSERSLSAPRSRKSESSPSRSRTLDRRSTETLPKQSDQKPAKVLSERARSISPFRRLSFSIGKSSKNSNAEVAQSPPHFSATLKSSRSGLDNPSTSSISDSSSFDNTSTGNRGRSSPLRRLLEPLMKPKSSNACRSPEPSLKGAPSSQQKHTMSDGQPSSSTLLSRNGKSSTVQALFRVTSKNDQPLFTFAVDKEQSITAATIRKHNAPEKEDYGHKYTFFTVQEVQKKNGKWMNQSRKVQGQEYTSNIVAQMSVSSSTPLISAGESSVDNLLTREFVLFASESQRTTNELAAMVIKIPKISDTSSTTLGDYFADVNATVVLPSGIHSLPHKGGPSSLIQRWKSGGSCDCGGWDMGCNLKILTNQHNKPRNPSLSTSEAFKLFFQGGFQDNNNQPLLSFTPYREGVYAVEYNSSSLSLLQAFSICIAVNEGRNSSKTVEAPNTLRVEKANGEVSSIQNERLKSFSGPIEAEAPAKYISHPPLSPVGRV